ncbi:fatty acid desaturase family protein [Rhodopila sp.]|uniref:fatty acid desaturase family protein n=1 Tax=Rhodopila sp. TaxID=2480087 RepID=UPI003D151EC6
MQTAMHTRLNRRALAAKLDAFQVPSVGRSIAQLASTAALYAVGLAAMYYVGIHLSPWLALVLTIPTAGFVVRLFIIQHDCGHGSFFRSSRANQIVGWFCGLLTFTPYESWRRQHAGHHAIWNNLDKRHGGTDLYSTCLTVEEYQALSPFRRWFYRLVRHPVVSQLLLPPLLFVVWYRLPFDTPKAWRKERRSVYLTNLGLVAVLATMVTFLGWKPVLFVQGPIMVIASIVGVWLFSVQHRFEDSEWFRGGKWSPAEAALHGCSLLRLPRLLQWFTGNIGFHHVHHMLPRVPNYRLQACHDAEPIFVNGVTTLTLRQALRAPSFALWDEARGVMVRFPSWRQSQATFHGSPSQDRRAPDEAFADFLVNPASGVAGGHIQ